MRVPFQKESTMQVFVNGKGMGATNRKWEYTVDKKELANTGPVVRC